MGRQILVLLIFTVAVANAAQSEFLSKLLRGIGSSPLSTMLEQATTEVEEEPAVDEQEPENPALPYCSSNLLAQRTFDYVTKKMDFKDPSPTERSMVTVIMTLNTLSGVVGNGLDFNTAYDAAPAFLILGENYPNLARDITLTILSDINEKIEPVVTLYNDNLGCLEGEDITVSDLKSCDQAVDAIIRNNPSLQGPGALVLQLGKLGKIFNARTPELEKIAKRQSHETVFSLGKAFLKPIIMQEAAAVKIMKEL